MSKELDPKWMWKNPDDCEKCGRDLVTPQEIERQVCDDCHEEIECTKK